MLKAIAFATSVALLIGLASPAFAQAAPGPMPKMFETTDGNGVTLSGAGTASRNSIRIPEPSVSIGDPKNGGLTWSRFHTAAGVDYGSGFLDAPNGEAVPGIFRNNNLWGQIIKCGLSPQYGVSLGQESDSIVFGPYDPSQQDQYHSEQYLGSSISYNSTTAEYTHMRGDGAVAVYSSLGPYAACSAGGGDWGRIKTLTKPDGEVITWNYYVMPSGPYAGSWRLQSVTNNLSYQIHFKYERDTAANAGERNQWYRIQKVTAIDNALNACGATALSCSDSTGGAWPYLIYGYESDNSPGRGGTGSVLTVADRLSNTSRYYYSGNVQTTAMTSVHLIAYRSPAAAQDDISLQSLPFRVTNAGGTWTYGVDGQGRSTVVNAASGYSRTITWSQQQPTPLYPLNQSLTASVAEIDTVNGRNTTYAYQFDALWGGVRLTRVTGHDGDYAEYEYAQGRRNVTRERRVAKPGSGLADINIYASYPESGVLNCVNTKTCNKPQSVTDPRGFVSTYIYDAGHGGLLTETSPAPGSGPYAAIQPQTRYTYASSGGVTRVATVKSCRTAASCAGTADETVIETTYTAKRVPSLAVTRAGDNSTAYTATNSRVSTTYTPQGDIESVDGPLNGTADKVWNYYDVARRLRVTVAPDPDGGGALQYRAMRTTYDADGNPTIVEQGDVSSPTNCSAANNFCAATMTVLAKSTVVYDGFGRKLRANVLNVGTGQPEAVTQTSYDAAGRVECVAVRMNSAIYGSLPASACTQAAVGSFGEDRIVRTTYTVNGDPSVIQSGYGTSLVRNERTVTYLAPGQTGTVKDAANNLTTYEYDGFDRPKKVRYPSLTVGVGTSSTTDYEEYGYDAAGNRTSERRRDGLMVYSTYDNLNRLRVIDKPGAELDVTNSYDSFANLISASQTGAYVSWIYDALGRVTNESQPNGTVSYAYDTAGRRTRIVYPGWPGTNFYVDSQYYDDGKLKLLGLNGATSGANVLATYYDDQLGRRASMCRGTGTTSSCSSVARTAYSYDAVSRLSGLSHDLVTGGAANDLSRTFSYSPASQLVTRTAATALYEWPYTATFNDAYVANGLNQYTSVAGAGLAYDGRGNTTNDTTKTYAYDSSNKLISASNGATLSYDPAGRLMSITQGGATTKFLYDGTRLIEEYNGSNTLLRRYVHGDGVDDPIVWFEGSGTSDRRNLFKDERGSVLAADTGSAVTTIKYDEYGNPSVTGSTVPRFQYTGQAWLSEIGLYYYKARIYNPDLGRFMQTDPIGYKDQMNLYAYVGNDPMGRIDPTGRCSTSTSLVSYGRLFCGGVEVPTEGTPQKTRGANGAAHAEGSVGLGKAMVGGSGTTITWDKFVYNRSVRTITGVTDAPKLRADTMGVEKTGPNQYRLHPGEVVSPRQTIGSEVGKWRPYEGRIYTNAKTGATFEIAPATARPSTASVGVIAPALGVLDLIGMLSATANSPPHDPLRGVFNRLGYWTETQAYEMGRIFCDPGTPDGITCL